MRDNGSGNGAGWTSLLLGTVALLMAVFQPVNDATQRGFLVSTVGITAIAYGIHALAKRRAGRATSSVAPRLGILFGTVGTAVMAYSLAAFLFVLPSNPMVDLVAGLHLPGAAPVTEPAWAAQAPLPVLEQPAAAVLPAPAPAPQPEAIPASTQSEEWAAVVQTAGTLAYVMSSITPAGQPWPASLAVTTDGRQRVITPAGQVLGSVPPGAVLSYQPSADLSAYTLTVTGSTFGVIADFSSYTGEVTTR